MQILARPLGPVLACVASTALTPAGSAMQSVLYDAGVAGAPPVAPNPATQGWAEIITGPTMVVDVSPDTDWGINAWQVTDPGGGCATYYTGLIAHMFDVGFEISAEIRMLAGSSTYLGISTGQILTDSYWVMSLSIQGQDVIVTDGPGNTYLCLDGADGAYHTYTMRNPTGYYPSDLELYYDGAHIGTIHELFGWFAFYSGISWGSGYYLAGSCAGSPARARFHRVQLRTLDYGPIGASYCGPAIPNSTGQSAVIEAEGIAAVALNQLTLTASNLPAGQFGYFLASRTQAFFMPPGSSGFICLGGNIGRYNGSVGQGPSLSLQVNLTSVPVNPPVAVQPGDTWNFQCWYRDVGNTNNFTDAVSVTFN